MLTESSWQAKDVGGYSDQQKAAIFGTAGKKEEKVVEEVIAARAFRDGPPMIALS